MSDTVYLLMLTDLFNFFTSSVSPFSSFCWLCSTVRLVSECQSRSIVGYCISKSCDCHEQRVRLLTSI